MTTAVKFSIHPRAEHILRSVGLLDNLTVSIVLATVILSGIAIGSYRSRKARFSRQSSPHER